ncbi:MAG TPA: hydantoinase/oxoprolinase N-terminal domain-containing protein [Gaiellaceae bacterium]
MRIGIDVGGTNTDAVPVDGRDVLAEAKTPTTPDVTGGILAALRALVESSGVAVSRVQAVMIGTTQFTNDVVGAGSGNTGSRETACCQRFRMDLTGQL